MLGKYFYDYFPIGLCLICRKKSSIVSRYYIIFCAIFRRNFCKTPIWSFSNYKIQQKIFFLYDMQNNNENLFNLHFQTKNKLYQKTEISIQ